MQYWSQELGKKSSQRGNNVVTHTGKMFSLKSVDLEWQAPIQFDGTILFRATVVQDFTTFWKDVVSSVVTVTTTRPQNDVDDNHLNVDELPRQQRHSQDFVATSKINVVETSTNVEKSSASIDASTEVRKQHNDYKGFNFAPSIHLTENNISLFKILPLILFLLR